MLTTSGLASLTGLDPAFPRTTDPSKEPPPRHDRPPVPLSACVSSLPPCSSLCSPCLPARAQTSGVANITLAAVTDNTGAAVPNAPVIVTNTDTGVSRNLVYRLRRPQYTANFLQPRPLRSPRRRRLLQQGRSQESRPHRRPDPHRQRHPRRRRHLHRGSGHRRVAPCSILEKTEVSQTIGQHPHLEPPRQQPATGADFVLNHPQRRPRRRLRPGQLPRHLRPLQPELRRWRQ